MAKVDFLIFGDKILFLPWWVTYYYYYYVFRCQCSELEALVNLHLTQTPFGPHKPFSQEVET